MNPSLFHRLLYKTKELVVEENEVLLRAGDKIQSLIIVKTGLIQLVLESDDVEMVVAQLGCGSVLNFRNIFIPREKMFVSVRCKTRANMLILSINELDHLASLDKEFDSKILRFINKIYKQSGNRKFMIDFMPPNSKEKCRCSSAFYSSAVQRKSTLQNVVLQVIN